jgi:phosphopantetheinyl transferase
MFFRTWTSKEAILKALGTGLSAALDTFAVDVSLGLGPHVSVHGVPGEWTVVLSQPICGYQAAVALPAAGANVKTGEVAL